MGQKTFEVTPSNLNSVLPQLQHRSSVLDEVKNAVSAGKAVVIHERAFTLHGFTGAGYVVTDSETGAGAYLIEGGANGGQATATNTEEGVNWSTVINLVMLGVSLATLNATVLVVAIVLVVSIVISAVQFYMGYMEAVEKAKCPAALPCIKEAFTKGFAAALLIAVLATIAQARGAWAAAAGSWGLIFGDELATGAAQGCNNLACQREIR